MNNITFSKKLTTNKKDDGYRTLRWISVSTNLPASVGEFLITLPDREVKLSSYQPSHGFVYPIGSGNLVQAVAWAEKPRPYTPDDNKN